MKDLGGILLGIYGLISQIFSIIYFIDICKEWDSLLAIILVGPFVAEFKGLLWIFFL